MAPQLALFEAARYHDPRVAADRARARAEAKLRPVRRCERSRPNERATVTVLPRAAANGPHERPERRAA